MLLSTRIQLFASIIGLYRFDSLRVGNKATEKHGLEVGQVKALPESESVITRLFFVAGGVSSLRTSWPAGLFVPTEIFLCYQA